MLEWYQVTKIRGIMSEEKLLDLAIIDGGLTGVTLAVGLLIGNTMSKSVSEHTAFAK